MGLYKQPNDWTCGPFALKHALVTIGQLADEQSIAGVAHPHWWAGTNEVKLARAARHVDCDLPMVRRTDADRARGALVRYVGQELPVIMCVDQWDHWITVVRHEDDRFVLLDSRREPVVQVMDWPRLRHRWQYVDEQDDRERGAGQALGRLPRRPAADLPAARAQEPGAVPGRVPAPAPAPAVKPARQHGHARHARPPPPEAPPASLSVRAPGRQSAHAHGGVR
jgi:hypothetical protein